MIFLGWGPYAYFQVLEESRGADTANQPIALAMEPQFDDQQEESSDGFMGLHLAPNSNPILEDIELGK